MDVHGPPRSGKKTIDLSLLRQTPPSEYRLDTGDVLGVYIEGVLGRREEIPPIHFPPSQESAPSLGYPLPVRDDGAISLPLVGSVPVRGLTVREVEERIRSAYTQERQILQVGRDRILVSLQRPRTYQILVIRQEAGLDGDLTSAPGMLNPGASKRGTGQVVHLPAYKNDVLHALAETGGLPGLDAENVIYVIRRHPMEQSDIPPHAEPVPVPPRGRIPLPPPAPPADSAAQKSMDRSPIQHTARWQPPQDAPWEHSIAPGSSSSREIEPTAGWSGASSGHSPYAPPRAYRHFDAVPPEPASVPPMQGPQTPWDGDWAHQPGFGHTIPPFDDPRFLSAMGDDDPTVANPNITKIPVRLGPGERPLFTEENIILRDGDIVFIESRDTEIFYTGGLLGGGQYTLPRDYDLDILGAISIAQSQGFNSGSTRALGGVSALNQDVTISASNVVILRPLPGGGQIPIKVNLYDALRDPNERIIIQPGDYIVLQYTRMEAIAAFFERHLLEGALFGLAASQLRSGR